MVFKYEDYSVCLIKQLCSVLQISLGDLEIVGIMRELESLLTSNELPVIDDTGNQVYKKTLLSQNHNTSSGKSNKFITLPDPVLAHLFNNTVIREFMEEHNYL